MINDLLIVNTLLYVIYTIFDDKYKEMMVTKNEFIFNDTNEMSITFLLFHSYLYELQALI